MFQSDTSDDSSATVKETLKDEPPTQVSNTFAFCV